MLLHSYNPTLKQHWSHCLELWQELIHRYFLKIYVHYLKFELQVIKWKCRFEFKTSNLAPLYSNFNIIVLSAVFNALISISLK
jgi:hypothetical protein